MEQRRRKSKKTVRPKRLYFSAKMSDYKFRKVLRAFADDVSATEAAGQARLSVNAATEAFGKLRTFFAEIGLFDNLYALDENPDPTYDAQLRAYHKTRVARMRGVARQGISEDLHFRESCWRFECRKLAEYGAQNVPDAMYQDFLMLIRLCGPVGRAPRNRLAGHRYMLARIERIAAWLERNSPAFNNSDQREELRHIRTF